MSAHPDSAPPPTGSGLPRTLLALLASGLGAIPLCQLISDRGWLVDVWLSMLVVLAPALLMRARRTPGALQIWPGIVLLVPWLTVRFLPHHAFLGVIPTRASWTDLSNLLDDLHRTTRDGVAPVHSTVAIKLALCAMLGLLAALVDLIAVVGRHGALAGVPLLVVYTVSGAVPRHAVHWQLFVFAAAGFLILLALDARDDLATWGHRVRRPDQARAREKVAMSGQRIAALAVVVAVLLPTLAPTKASNLIANLVHGSTSKHGSGFGAGGGSIDPFVALKGQLNRTRTLDLATVTVSAPDSAHPFYLRENVLSDYTGEGWKAADHGNQENIAGSGFGTLPDSNDADISRFEADVKVTGLTGNPPVFALPSRVTGVDSATWAPQDQLVLGTSLHKGDEYRETVEQPDPSVADLEGAPGGVAGNTTDWLKLPDIPKQVRDLVARIIKGKSGPYDRARAISDFFANPANHFRYSLETAAGDSGSALVDFLTNRVGFCQQYAAAMAVMLRLAQVPSRVVLGYTHQPADAAGSFTITTNDAHAWDEAYFAGVGWVPFDPTPLSGADGARASALPWAPHNDSTGSTTAAPSNSATLPHISNAPRPQPSAPPVASLNQGGSDQSAAGWLIPVLVVVALAALVLLPWFTRRRRRRLRLRAARSGDPDPLWAELIDTAVDLGYVWSPARSPRQVVRWLREPAGDASGSLRELAQAVEQRRYGPGELLLRDHDLAGDLDAVADRLRGAKDRKARMRARLWPASLNWWPVRTPAARARRKA